MSHAGFLRDEWPGQDKDFLRTIREFRTAGLALNDVGPNTTLGRVASIAQSFSERDAAIIKFAAKLTLTSGQVTADDVSHLRTVGLSDRDVHDVVLVISCFAFMNRLADGTGVTVQPDRYHLAREFFGDSALEAHLQWAESTEAGNP